MSNVQRNTALVIFAFNRQDLTQNLLVSLSAVNCPIFISIDSPKSPSQSIRVRPDISLSRRNVEVIEHKSHLGGARHVTGLVKQILEKYENIIVLEDDIVVDARTINYVVKLLENRLPNDVMTLGLFGFLPGSNSVFRALNYWRKTKYFSPWGWATQREAWQDFNLNITGIFEKLYDSKSWQDLSYYEKKVWLSRFSKVIKNPLHTYDYQVQFYSFLLNKKHLLPLFRLSDNLGFDDERAQHTSGPKPRWYFGEKGVLTQTGFNRLTTWKTVQRFWTFLDRSTWAQANTVLPFLQKIFQRVSSLSSFRLFSRRQS